MGNQLAYENLPICFAFGACGQSSLSSSSSSKAFQICSTGPLTKSPVATEIEEFEIYNETILRIRKNPIENAIRRIDLRIEEPDGTRVKSFTVNLLRSQVKGDCFQAGILTSQISQKFRILE